MRKNCILVFLMYIYICSMLFSHKIQALEETRLTKQDLACIQEIFFLLHNRLEVAREIAKWKWNYRIPIDVRNKEQQLIQQLLSQASKDEIDIHFCTNVIISQITAAKKLQIQLFENWIADGVYLIPFPNSDLLTLEEDILEIDRKIICRLMHLYAISDRKDFLSYIAFASMEIFPEGQIAEDVRNEMIRPFLEQANWKKMEN